MTPVYAAAIQGQDEVTEILLEHGSDADTVSKLDRPQAFSKLLLMLMINVKGDAFPNFNFSRQRMEQPL